jgi:IclR family KDG regulon transcriptional repressor
MELGAKTKKMRKAILVSASSESCAMALAPERKSFSLYESRVSYFEESRFEGLTNPPVHGIILLSYETLFSQNENLEIAMSLLERGLDILEFICANGGVGVHDISRALDVPTSTAYRILGTLQERGYVRHSGPGCYEVGSRLLTLQGVTERQNQLMQVARPHLRQLAWQTGQTAHLAVLSTNQVGYIDTVIGQTGLSVYPSLGSSSPLYCTSLGKVLLAYLPQKLRESILAQLKFEPHTQNTITSRQHLEEHLHEVRQQGYALDNEELNVGLRCIGAPVRSAAGDVIAGISISGLAAQFVGDAFPTFVKAVRQTAGEISADLGYQSAPFIREQPKIRMEET